MLSVQEGKINIPAYYIEINHFFGKCVGDMTSAIFIGK